MEREKNERIFHFRIVFNKMDQRISEYLKKKLNVSHKLIVRFGQMDLRALIGQRSSHARCM